MASQSQGIQQLLQAEKRAAEKVADARKRKARRLKQAKEEAQMEVEQYRREREQEFQSKQQANSDPVSHSANSGHLPGSEPLPTRRKAVGASATTADMILGKCHSPCSLSPRLEEQGPRYGSLFPQAVPLPVPPSPFLSQLEQVCPSLEPTRPQVTLTTGPRTPWELSVLAALHQHAHMEGCPERRPAWQEPKGSGETHRRLFFRSLAPAYWQPRRREAGVEGSQKPEVKADPFLRRCCRRHTRPPCSAL
ncbi:V-type proton ATPase subunit G 2 isoform X1 [Loxodonta africana]|uniref:V-type proton ATPase subunit G 2 isoform X1 n=1 Tax=Loxodonta africana TaxID=9785 RepID=UPI0030CDE623